MNELSGPELSCSEDELRWSKRVNTFAPDQNTDMLDQNILNLGRKANHAISIDTNIAPRAQDLKSVAQEAIESIRLGTHLEATPMRSVDRDPVKSTEAKDHLKAMIMESTDQDLVTIIKAATRLEMSIDTENSLDKIAHHAALLQRQLVELKISIYRVPAMAS